MTKLLALFGDRADEAVVTGGASTPCANAGWSGATPRSGWSPRQPPACPGTPVRPPSRRRDPTADEIAELIEGLDAAQRDLLNRLLDGLTDRPDPRRRARHTTGPPGAAAAGGRPASPGRRRDGDPAPAGRPGAARRSARPVEPDQPDPDGVHHHCRAMSTPSAAGAVIDLLREVEMRARNTRRHTGSRAAQRRPRCARRQAAGQDHRHRRTAAGPDPRGLCGGRADRGRHARPRSSRRRGTVLGADGRRRPVHRIADAEALASARLGLAGSAGPPRPDRQPRSRRQTLCGPVGFALLHRRAAGPAAALSSAGRTAAGLGGRRQQSIARDDVAPAALVGAAAARTGRRPARPRPRRRPWSGAAR